VIQILVALATLVISGVVTLIIALALKATIGWRVPEDVEIAGIDGSEHAESAYDMNTRGGRMGVSGFGSGDSEAAPAKNLEGAKS
jgi:ammonium transporter, Amt family